MVVDDETMSVTHGPMPVRMTVRFGAGRGLVLVVLVGAVGVHVLMDQFGVGMRQDLGVVLRPELHGERREDQHAEAECERRDRHADVGAKQTGHRVENEPAGVRKGELGGKVRGTVRGR